MRVVAVLLLVAIAGLRAEEPAKALTPAEAAKKLNEKVTVEFEVQSTGGNTNNYLNSEADFKSDKNFTILIPKEAIAKFKAAKIDDPKTHYKGKLVRVTGTVTANKDKAQIRVESPEQIVVVEKKKD
jgi:DNA/RNA endonuclease YhcR with UshA esterase domain